MTDTPTAPLGELTPRQKALRDNEVSDDHGVSTRRTERLLEAERYLSKQQAMTYNLIRLREHNANATGLDRQLVTWILAKIDKAIAASEQRCAEQQNVIDALRAGR